MGAHTESLCHDAATLQNVISPALSSLSSDVSLALTTINDFKKQRFGHIAEGVLSDTTLRALLEEWKKVSNKEQSKVSAVSDAGSSSAMSNRADAGTDRGSIGSSDA